MSLRDLSTPYYYTRDTRAAVQYVLFGLRTNDLRVSARRGRDRSKRYLISISKLSLCGNTCFVPCTARTCPTNAASRRRDKSRAPRVTFYFYGSVGRFHVEIVGHNVLRGRRQSTTTITWYAWAHVYNNARRARHWPR